MKRLKLLKIVY